MKETQEKAFERLVKQVQQALQTAGNIDDTLSIQLDKIGALERLSSVGNPIDLEVHTLINEPLGDENKGDPLSRIYKKLLNRTPSPPATTLFNIIFYASAFLVANASKIHRPANHRPIYADTWTMILSPTGSMKTVTAGVLKSALPPTVISAIDSIRIEEIQSKASLISTLSKRETVDGLTLGAVEMDEAGQFIKEIENPNNIKSALKKSFLEMKDNSRLSHETLDRTDVVEKPVIALRFMNTIEQMSKAISPDSWSDGFARRFAFVLAEKTKWQQENLFPTFEIDDKTTKISEDLAKLFGGKVYSDYYFKEEVRDFFDETYRRFFPQFLNALGGTRWEAFIHSYFQDAWKYAVVHHFLFNKKGDKVGIESMEWAINVVFYTLNSFNRFLKDFVERPAMKHAIEKGQSRNEQIKAFLNEEGKNGETGLARETCRKFSIKTEALFEIVQTLQEKDKQWKNPLKQWTQRQIEKKKRGAK